MPENHDDETTYRSRKQHKKSRAGCANCKQKRIKCDELKPACGNCTRRFDRCSFLQDSTRASTENDDQRSSFIQAVSRDNSTTLSPPEHVEPNASISAFTDAPPLDFELWHHMLMKTGPSLASEGNVDELNHWQTVIPEYGLKNQHLMSLLLALAAYHSFRTHYHRPELLNRAEDLYGRALPTIIEQLSHLGTENCETLYLCSTLICFINFARGPRPGQYIAFSDEGGAEWFTLLRGVRMIMEKYRTQLAKGVLAKTYTTYERKANLHLNVPLPRRIVESPDRDHDLSRWFRALADERALFEKYVDSSALVPSRIRLSNSRSSLEKLKIWLDSLVVTDQSFARYEDPLKDLSSSFLAYSRLERGETEFPIVFGWLYRISDEYVYALQAKKPVALVIFAYYCILLRELEDQRWLLKGWSAHVFNGVVKYLHPDYHQWIERPKDVILQ